MFFSKKPVICYCSSTSLKIIDAHSVSHTLPFPSNTVCYGEIADENSFKKLVNTFIAELNLQKSKIFIVLSPELVFTEVLDSLNKTEPFEINKIISLIPIKKTEAVTVVTTNKNNHTYYITSKQLFELLVKILEEKQLTTIAVVPVIIFGHLSKDNHLSITNLQKGILDEKIVEKHNFLDKKNQLIAQEFIKKDNFESAGGKNYRKYYILILSLLVLLIAVWSL